MDEFLTRKAPDYLQTSFTVSSDVHTRMLRSSSTYQVYVPKHNLDISPYLLFFLAAQFWNSSKFKIQYPSKILKSNMLDGHILYFLLRKINVHAALPGVSAEYTANLVCDYCFYVEEHMVD